jgi:hypothetical protein
MIKKPPLLEVEWGLVGFNNYRLGMSDRADFAQYSILMTNLKKWS